MVKRQIFKGTFGELKSIAEAQGFILKEDVRELIDDFFDGCARHDGSVSWYCVEEEDLKELKAKFKENE